MHPKLLDILRCPLTGEALTLQEAEYEGDRVETGWLVSARTRNCYPIRNSIPRFVETSNYADSFGMQWNQFRKTQLDSHSGLPISANRFWRATGWQPSAVAGQWVLDVGCGAGRFAEIALQAGGRVVALDFSSAVDACYANFKQYPDLHVLQADLYALPFANEAFPFVYSLGVLQHTPDVRKAFAALPAMLAPGGRLCVDVYWKRVRTMLHTKYLLRPLTKRLPPKQLFGALRHAVPVLLTVSQQLGRIPLAGRVLKRLIPVADYTGIYPLSDRQLQEFALLDTFDMLAPRYDNPQTSRMVRHWFDSAGLEGVEIFLEGHLVGRGHKPQRRRPLVIV